ncbi:MAG TPA: sialidase family protein [Verrucomicrobiota bacterium]|nr:sialidase family protein [Verrucomicrobiota bacterium]HNU52228.1 sialidase family protein [Verrucomicrobiota bacterium]
MNIAHASSLLLVSSVLTLGVGITQATELVTPYGISRQVNVDAQGRNIPGDAANEPSLCLDPINPSRIAVGWRQFDTTNSSFRQSGVAYTTNGGLQWTFPGNLDPGIFRSDPVLAADADGTFYYLGITNTSTFACDLLRSTDGGATWQMVGPALGGDKEWMAIDTTSGPGRGNLYQVWSPFYNVYANNRYRIFTRSTDGGLTWMPAIDLPHQPYWGTLAVGPDGEVYQFGKAIDTPRFWLNRSRDAANPLVTPTIDVSTSVDLGGPMLIGLPGVNPGGLLGQAWVAVDSSPGPTRGHVYVLCSVTNDPGNLLNVMFSRSTDGGRNWSAPVRVNDDAPNQHAAHWFGTLSVAPNGRIDACWNDTRNSADHTLSELYYSWSDDGGVTWAANRPLSPPFNHSLGYPQQNKMGDYIGMVSLVEGACIAYAATFNGEQDIFFVRAELPIQVRVTPLSAAVQISWNAVPGVTYCVQAQENLDLPWSASRTVACLTADSSPPVVDDPWPAGHTRQFYRVVRLPTD